MATALNFGMRLLLSWRGRVWLLCMFAGACSAKSSGPDGGRADTGGPGFLDAGQEQVADRSPDQTDGAAEQPDPGTSGPIGAAECFTDSDCEARLASFLAAFEVPASYFHMFDGAACIQTGIIAGAESRSGPACNCQVKGSGGGSLSVGPVGPGCSIAGRINNCLYEAADFPGCDPDAADADVDVCTTICSDAQSRLAADAQVTYTTTIRYARCETSHCQTVFRIGDACFSSPAVLHARDCSLSNEELLANP